MCWDLGGEGGAGGGNTEYEASCPRLEVGGLTEVSEGVEVKPSVPLAGHGIDVWTLISWVSGRECF